MDVNLVPQTETEAYLDDAVAEYIYARNSIQSAFLSGVIQLGSILSKHREELKKHGTWMKFCVSIGLHISQATQQIRMYELSLENTKIDIIKKTITNWTKLNLFMSLEDDQKAEIIHLAEESKITAETTAEEFRGAINDVKGVDLEADEVETVVIEPIRNPLHENSKFAAEAIRSAANMSHRAKPFLEAYSTIQKGIEILMDEDIAKLDEEEGKEITALIVAQYAELSDIVKNYL